jgi:hypothetical protein
MRYRRMETSSCTVLSASTDQRLQLYPTFATETKPTPLPHLSFSKRRRCETFCAFSEANRPIIPSGRGEGRPPCRFPRTATAEKVRRIDREGESMRSQREHIYYGLRPFFMKRGSHFKLGPEISSLIGYRKSSINELTI